MIRTFCNLHLDARLLSRATTMASSLEWAAAWPRWLLHLMRRLLAQGPKSAQAMGTATVRIILDQPDRSAAHAYLLQVVEALRARFPSAVHLLLDAAGEILAFYDLPSEHHRQIDSPLPVRTNMGAPSCTDPGTFGGCAIGTYCSILSCMTDEINTHEAKTVLSGGRAAHALPPPP